MASQGGVHDGPLAAAGEHSGAAVRVAEVEAAGDRSLGVVAEGVQFLAVGHLDARIDEQGHIVVHFRRAPDLHRLRDGGIARLQNRLGVGARQAAAGGIGRGPFQGDAREAAATERQPGVAGHHPQAAVALVGFPPPALQGQAIAVALELVVDDPGDGVRAVLSRGAIAQHLHLVDRHRRNHRQVRPLGASGQGTAQLGDDRPAMAALAVDQHQGVVRRQTAQGGGPRDGGRITNGVPLHVVGRQQIAQHVVHVGGAHVLEVLARDHVHGHGGIRHRTLRPAGAEHHEFLEFLDFRLGGQGEASGQEGRCQERGTGDRQQSTMPFHFLFSEHIVK